MEVTLSELPKFASNIVESLHGGDILTLTGPLASGKTTLTKAILEQLGYPHKVSSPSFVLERRYPINNHPSINEVIHIDFYRLKPEHVSSFDWHEEAGTQGVLTIIEWPEVAGSQIRSDNIKQIAIEVIDEQTRRFTLSDNFTPRHNK